MTIEEAIKQEKFADVYQKTIVNLFFTNSVASHRFTLLFKPYGISMQQFNVLRILKGQKGEPASINLIIDRMLDKQSNASRLVEKLRLKGLVERLECPSDRRKVDVVISKKGLKLLEELGVVEDDLLFRLKHLSQDEAETLNNLLDKLRLNL